MTFLQDWVRDGDISQETADRALAIWNAVPQPTATCTGPDGQLMYTWDSGRHHLEVEIAPGEPAFWFYRDRDQEGGTWSEASEAVPATAIALLGARSELIKDRLQVFDSRLGHEERD